MAWYVLMARAGQENKASKEIKNSWDMKDVLPFVPVKETYFREAKKLKREIMFPGYVFVESKIPESEFKISTLNYMKNSQIILKLLDYGDSGEIEIREAECVFLKSLLNENYCLEFSKGIIEGERIIITEGAFIGRESVVKKINRHKMQAIIEIEFLGGIRQVSIGLEIVEKR